MKISPARAAAFDVLLRIETEKAFSSVLLPEAEEGLSSADRGLCHELVLGTLRKQIFLDRLISALTGDRTIDDAVRIALRLAIYQLKFLDRIPSHSAVNESVNLVHRAKKSSARAFVNGVLRQFLRKNAELTYSDDVERLSVETSHPRWLLEKWIKDRGMSDASKIAVANNIPPSFTFRLIDDAPELQREVEKVARASEYVQGCFIAHSRSSFLADLAREGRIYLQDEASQMVGNMISARPRERILDVCASPGGKTGILARNAAMTSAHVFAGDLTSRRVKLLANNCRRQGAELSGIIQYDAGRSLPFETASFDHVLVDAPCSGTGTIRHNPELRYLLEPADIGRFSDKQRSILHCASEMVRPGGQLVYSTCSLEEEENDAVCTTFVEEHNDFMFDVLEVPARFLSPDRFARTRPDRDDMDGFFIAAFRRRS